MTASPDGRKTLVVVGGGAAGYFGAIQAAAAASGSLDVFVLEAGRKPLQKVKISGGGRCNVMHDTTKVCTTEDQLWTPMGSSSRVELLVFGLCRILPKLGIHAWRHADRTCSVLD